MVDRQHVRMRKIMKEISCRSIPSYGHPIPLLFSRAREQITGLAANILEGKGTPSRQSVICQTRPRNHEKITVWPCLEVTSGPCF